MSCLLRVSDCPGVLRRGARVLILLPLLLCLFAGGRSASAQEAGGITVPAVEPEEKKLSPEEIKAKQIAEAKAAAELEKARQEALAEILNGTTELTPEQLANFEKWLPHTFKRLQKRLPVHIVALGDSVTRYISFDENCENSHYAFHGVFAAKLADEFFYTGGVRDIRPTKGHKAKLEETLGPELTLENIGMDGRLSLHALSRITTDALVNQPDLVIINFGINDALWRIGLATYVEALERSVHYVKSTGADVILIGPSHMMPNAAVAELAQTRPYSGAMEELAARLGVFYFDLSDVTMRAAGIRPGQTAEQALASVVASFRETSFDHGSDKFDGLHPSQKAHRVMGVAAFEGLRDGKKPDPYRVKGFLTLGGAGKAVLEFKVKNLEEVATSGQLLLMPIAGMQPEKKSLPFELGAGKGQVFKVNYQSRAGGVFDLPADAPRVFVPMILADTRRSYSPLFAAAVMPFGVVWNSGAMDLSRGEFEVKCSFYCGLGHDNMVGTLYVRSVAGDKDIDV